MVRRMVVLGALAVLAGCGPSGEVVGPRPAWTLTWSDEFDGPALTPPDGSRWTYDLGGDGWGNQQLEFNSDNPDNVSLDGQGNLVITARRQAVGNNAFTSARIKTQGRFSKRYGRIEARIKLPAGRGIWPAFWMLGDDIAQVSWPRCGEIDIMELRGQEPGVLIGSMHGPGYSAGAAISSRYRLPGGATFDQDFHRFAVEWDPTRVAYLMDDVVYQVVSAPSVLGRGEWVFDQPFFLILNVAVGGNFVGSPDLSTPFPVSMTVDWVRVFDRAP